MSEAKHTPGNWKVIETHLLPWDGDHVADLSNGLMVVPEFGQLGDALADACLIAAAPELKGELIAHRQALQLLIGALGLDVETAFNFSANGAPIASITLAELMKRADAAIAKAEGRAPHA